ncbi:hypothetical protein SeLEV6574_g06748 [Synchytrium endobioticum]|uniref:Peptidase M20 domain-containing protein 2 n=1 Tax=Synchytrium endobioticum TaxID=286115 RepID=A0A507CKQ3_9FUNG|nr:hypothetical protein SeLEV6574_g06748 [Synchytrium endobioticum]
MESARMPRHDHVRSIVAEAIESHAKELQRLSLQIHAHPELGFQEHFAHDILTSYLEDQGFIVKRKACSLDTAWTAEYTPSSTTPQPTTIAFLSEYDALPMGHACGHNLIAVVGIAAAIGLKAAMNQSRIQNARLRVYGTPAEETVGGKIRMIDAGAFEDVDVALMGHGGNNDIVYCNALAMQTLRVEFFGKAAHAAAAPWEGVNALDAIVQAYSNISMLRQQILPSNRIHGIIRQGGSAPNVIPERGEWYIRAQLRDDLNALKPKVLACFEASAHATGCTHKVEEEPPFYDIKSNETLVNLYTKYAENEGVVFPPKEAQLSKLLGSTDMGNVTHVVPGIHPIFDIGCEAGIHTEDFREHAKTDQAHAAAFRCARVLAMVGFACMEPSILAAVKKDFAA